MDHVRANGDIIGREWRRAGELLSQLPDGAWASPTRCEGWTVADLVAHACWGTSFEADGLRRARAGEPGVAEGAEIVPTRRTGELREQLAANVAALGAEIDALCEAPRRPDIPMPYGSIPAAVAVEVFAMEAGVHVSDLAAALGHGDDLPDDVCLAALGFLRAFGPALADQGGAHPDPGLSVALDAGIGVLRLVHDGAGWRADDDPRASTTIAGSASDVVLFALGRRPLEVVTVSGRPDLAIRFKQFLPGP